MKKFIRVRTVMYTDLEVDTDNLPPWWMSATKEAVKDHVTDMLIDKLAARSTYFEHEIQTVSDTELEPEEH